MRILLVEDDEMIGTSLYRGLRDEGYAVDWVKDGLSALTALRDRQTEYALALLDWGLPKRNGVAVLKALRDDGNRLPVLMITARDSRRDAVMGLDAGADDYLVKPFEMVELKARMRSLLRRSAGRMENELRQGDLVLNPVRREVRLKTASIDLTPREYSLLYALLEQPGTILSRAQLEERLYAWDESVESNMVEFLIHGVRKKLGASWIENVRNVGWRIGSIGGAAAELE